MKKGSIVTMFLLALMCCGGTSAWALTAKTDGTYVIRNAADLYAFAQLVNGGQYGANAIVTADIDYRAYGTKGDGLIGGIGQKIDNVEFADAYVGSFDAQNHKITIATNLDRATSGRAEGMGGLFGCLGEGSKISNLWLDGTLTGNGHRMSGLCQNVRGTTLTNILVSVDITSTWKGEDSDLASGGILGQAEKANYLKNVVFSGSFKCKDNGSTQGGNNEWFGGLLGWVETGPTTMENCVAIIHSVEQDAASAFKSQNPGGKQKNSPMSRHDENLVIAKNCFYQLPPQWTTEWENYKDYFIDNGDKDWEETVMTKQQVMSGELCYKLNEYLGVNQFTQDIDIDYFVIPFPCHDKVYYTDGNYTNYNGVYYINSPEKLNLFAHRVNAGGYNLNAVVTADIDYTAYGTDGNGLIGGIGQKINNVEFADAYVGSFDAQGHKIKIATNLDRATSGRAEGMGGLFGCLGEGSKISNLWLDGTLTGNGHRMSGLCQNVRGTTLTNILVSVDITSTWKGEDSDLASGGILGQAEKANYLKNVTFAGSFKCKDNGSTQGGNNEWFGGLLGWVETGPTTMENCIAIINSVEQDAASAFKSQNPGGKQKNSPMSRHDENLVIAKNCFYQLPPQWTTEWENYKDYFVDNGDKDWEETVVTASQVANGELTYWVNGKSSEDCIYFQNIGMDKYPIPIENGHGIVYNHDGNYTNADGDGYYTISTPEQLYAFAKAVNAGDYGRSARVTADIDYTAYGTKGDGLIGGIGQKIDNVEFADAYVGSFDAQNHKITIATNLDRATSGRAEGMGGLFGCLGEGSKISNLWLDGTLTGNGHRMSGLCQNVRGTTLTNILVSVDITSTWKGEDSDLASGGILGQAEKANYLKNVTFAGSFKCKGNEGHTQGGNNEWFAGLLGWVETGPTTMENCVAIISSVEQDAASAFKSQNPGGKQKNSPMSRHDENLVIAKNCYYQLPPQWTTEWENYKDYFIDNGDKDWEETVVTPAQLQSGEICFKLNGDQTEIGYWQTIGVDLYPTPIEEENGQVYLKDGHYTNDDVDIIRTAEDLYAFAKAVNAGDYARKAKVVADIDYTEYGTKGDALIGGIGQKINNVEFADAYVGSFDAQGHKIKIATNLDRATSGRAEGMGGLFGCLGEGSKISNLWLDGTLTGNGHRMSGLCQNVRGTTLQNILVTVDITSTWKGEDSDLASGGILGQAEKANYLKNVVFSGSFKCKGNEGHTQNGNNEWFAGLLGWVETGPMTMENCVAIIHSVEQDAASAFKSQNPGGKQKNSPMSRHDENLVIAKNCFYQLPPQWTTEWENYKDYFVDNGDKDWEETVLTDEMIKGGELTFRLNGNQSDIVFYQTLGTDEIPYISNNGHKQVYGKGDIACSGELKGNNSFSNTPPNEMDPHNFVDGKCTVCGALSSEAVLTMDADGYYVISDKYLLQKAIDKVNAGETNLNFRLYADVDFTDDDYKLSNFSTFSGIFDGQYHTLKVNMQKASASLFGTLNGTVRNLTVTGKMVNTGEFAGVITAAPGNCTIENVVSDVEFHAHYSGTNGASCMGGFIGNGGERTINLTNCVFTGHFIQDKVEDSKYEDPNNDWYDFSQIAGLMGRASTGANNIRNCIVAGEAPAYFGPCHPQSGNRMGQTHVFEESSSFVGIKRGTPNVLNLYATVDYTGDLQWGQTLSSEVAASGEICYTLNGGGWDEPAWRQNIGEDAIPMPTPYRGIVYKIESDNKYMDVHDVTTMQMFQPEMKADETLWYSTAIASESELAGYEEYVEAAATAATVEEFKAAYKAMKEKRTAINENVAAYESYMQLAQEAKDYLEENKLEGEYADKLKSYLYDTVEAGNVFPNGSYIVVIEDQSLNTQGIKDEKDYLSELFRNAIGNDYQPGGDITILVANADFSNGTNLWNGKKATGAANIQGAMPVLETWRNTSDMYQTLTGLKDGVYELQMNAYTRTAGNDDARFYTAYVYANDVSLPVMNLQEDPISFNDAVDNENCYIGNAGSYPYDVIFNDSYFYPNSYTGAAFAFKGHRFENNVTVQVTNGTLKLGIRQEGSGFDADWLVFGHVKLFYRGELADSEPSLDATLGDFIDRANTVLYADPSGSMGDNCTPNFYAGYRTSLEEAIANAEAAATAAEKYAAIQRFSSLFAQVKTCQLAYISVLQKIQTHLDEMTKKHEAGEITDDEYAAAQDEIGTVETNYWDGVYTTLEAQNLKWTITSVDRVEAAADKAPVIYNLQGQKVQNVEKGRIYIVNGKKMLVK